jgi:hypothetical protein
VREAFCEAKQEYQKVTSNGTDKDTEFSITCFVRALAISDLSQKFFIF